jgi:hypothetical protein
MGFASRVVAIAGALSGPDRRRPVWTSLDEQSSGVAHTRRDSIDGEQEGRSCALVAGARDATDRPACETAGLSTGFGGRGGRAGLARLRGACHSGDVETEDQITTLGQVIADALDWAAAGPTEHEMN